MGTKMGNAIKIVEGNYWRDILQQPKALEDTMEALRESPALWRLAQRLSAGRLRQVILTGMGSSFHGLHPIYLDLVGHGLPALMVETSELLHYQRKLFNPRNLIVAVSQSGRSAEVVSMLRANRRRSIVVAITNTPESPLARGAHVVVPTIAGEEFSVSCKTYTAALMALRWLGDVLCGKSLRRTRRELADAPILAAAYLASWKKHVLSLARRLDGASQLYLVGRGASLAAAGTGGLIIKESDHFPAEGMSSAAFRHGPLEIVTPKTFVLLFSGAQPTRELNHRLALDIRKRDGGAELIGDDARFRALRLSHAPDSIRPILEILPVEMITLALAALANREAGRFERAAKVTTTE